MLRPAAALLAWSTTLAAWACRPMEARCVSEAGRSLPPGYRSCRLEARLEVEVRGAERFSDRGRRTIRIVEVYGGRMPREAWFANMGMELPVDFARNLKYRLSFDVAPGTYRGPGRYMLGGQRPSVAGLSSPLTDKAALEITSLVPPRVGLLRYERLVKPCRLTVQDHVTRGALDCPKLADQEGKTVSVRASWRPA